MSLDGYDGIELAEEGVHGHGGALLGTRLVGREGDVVVIEADIAEDTLSSAPLLLRARAGAESKVFLLLVAVLGGLLGAALLSVGVLTQREGRSGDSRSRLSAASIAEDLLFTLLLSLLLRLCQGDDLEVSRQPRDCHRHPRALLRARDSVGVHPRRECTLRLFFLGALLLRLGHGALPLLVALTQEGFIRLVVASKHRHRSGVARKHAANATDRWLEGALRRLGRSLLGAETLELLFAGDDVDCDCGGEQGLRGSGSRHRDAALRGGPSPSSSSSAGSTFIFTVFLGHEHTLGVFTVTGEDLRHRV
jgi:hypothetical protein